MLAVPLALLFTWTQVWPLDGIPVLGTDYGQLVWNMWSVDRGSPFGAPDGLEVSLPKLGLNVIDLRGSEGRVQQEGNSLALSAKRPTLMIDTGLKNKVVIVTGGANGIGRGTALAFATQGCRVAVWDVKGDETALIADLKEAGAPEATFTRVSVADAALVAAATAKVMETFGQIDVLINNAGILRDGMLVKVKDGQVTVMSDEQFDLVIDANLRGVFLCTRAVAPHMIARKTGVIVSASSVVGLYGNFGQTNYVATKAGVIGMTRVWAREMGKHGIRVNAIAPGFIETEMVRQMPQKALETMVQHTPLGRMGTVDDIANAYVYLASDQGSFITGHCLSVDGGAVPGT